MTALDLYKLTDQTGRSRFGIESWMQWGPGITNSSISKSGLSSPQYISCYPHPLLAVFMNRSHGFIRDPLLWRCRGTLVEITRGFRHDCSSLTTIETMSLPPISVNARVDAAIRYVQTLEGATPWTAAWDRWADRWLDGTDRSYDSAASAALALPNTWRGFAAGSATRSAAAAAVPTADGEEAAIQWTADAVALVAMVQDTTDPRDFIAMLEGGIR